MERHTELLSRLYLQQQVELQRRKGCVYGSESERVVALLEQELPVYEKLRCLCEGGIDKVQEYDRLRRAQMNRLREEATAKFSLFLKEVCSDGEASPASTEGPHLTSKVPDWRESPLFRHLMERPVSAVVVDPPPLSALGKRQPTWDDRPVENACDAAPPLLKRPRPAFQYNPGTEQQQSSEPAVAAGGAFVTAKTKLIQDAQDGVASGMGQRGNGYRPGAGAGRGGRGPPPPPPPSFSNEPKDVFDSSFNSNYALNSDLAGSRGGRSSNLGARRRLNGGQGAEKEESATSKLVRSISEKVFQVKGAGVAQALIDPDSGELPEQLRGCDPQLVENIMNEFLDRSPLVNFDDIAGLFHAKKAIEEMIIWPLQRPDLFQGIRAAPKGLLMFGPPGTGKTMIGKAVATQGGCTFFNISASSLMSKWVGEGEKMVRTLFAVAAFLQPTVVFIDEIDSLLCQRSEGDMEGSRRVKTEFLVQMDGAGSRKEDVVIVIGATNRPQEIDEAARRRLSKRLYIPLPNSAARDALIKHHLNGLPHNLTQEDLKELVKLTVGYSGADLTLLCQDASLYPIREVPHSGLSIDSVTFDSLRPLNLKDFHQAMTQVKASVSDKDLALYEDWNRQFGATFEVDDHRE